MKTLNKKITAVLATATIFTFTLTGCSNNNSSKNAKKDNQITVTYTLREGKKEFATKKVTLPKKNAKVMTGLQKAWKVKQTKGFITSIDGKSQNPKKKIYWTYTVNDKYANKGATQYIVHNKDKVKFTLDKMKG